MNAKVYFQAMTAERHLKPIADRLGLPTAQISFLLALALSCVLALPVARLKGRRDSALLHLYSAGSGVALVFLACGAESWMLLLQVLLGYAMLRWIHPRYCHGVVLVMAMGILAWVHFWRLFRDDGGFDISFPLMLSTQKVTTLAFGLHDARAKKKEERQESRRFHVDRPPSLLLYLDYMLYFHGVLVGPISFFPDFLRFLENSPEERPSRKRFLVVRFFLCVFYGFMLVAFTPVLPTNWNKDPSMFLHWSFSYRIWFNVFSLHILRYKFYFAWTAGEALQVAVGLGYNSSTRKWDKLRNIDPAGLEFATSPRAYIDAWNLQTNAWLRYLTYWRLSSGLRIVSTFVLSAVWHGFHPGYYLTFLCAIPMTHAARKMRRTLRPFFACHPGRLRLYDIATWAATHVFISSLVTPFVLLNLRDCLTFYALNQRWVCHVIVVGVLLLPLPDRSFFDKLASRAVQLRSSGAA